jgi:beta-glucanase (GH16 family)
MNGLGLDRDVVADPRDEWHVYEFQWTPDYISWLYDGEEVRRVDASWENPEIDYMWRE